MANLNYFIYIYTYTTTIFGKLQQQYKVRDKQNYIPT